MKPKIPLFNANEVFELVKAYKNIIKSDNNDDYEVGIIQGLDYVLYLMDAME